MTVEPDPEIEVVQPVDAPIPDVKAHSMRRETTIVSLIEACPTCDEDLTITETESMGRPVEQYKCPSCEERWVISE